MNSQVEIWEQKYKETIKAEGDDKKPTLNWLYLHFIALLFPNEVTLKKLNFSDVSPTSIL